MRKPKLRGRGVCQWCPAKIGCEYPFIWPRNLYSFSSNMMCFEHRRCWINTCWVIATNIKYSFQIVRDSRCWAHVQGGFHTICAKDIGTKQLFLNIKESHETLMVRRLSFMKVLNLFFRTASLGEGPWLQLSHLEIDTEQFPPLLVVSLAPNHCPQSWQNFNDSKINLWGREFVQSLKVLGVLLWSKS